MKNLRIVLGIGMILVGLIFLMMYKLTDNSSIELLKQVGNSKTYVIKLASKDWFDTNLHLTPQDFVIIHSREGSFLSGLPSDAYTRQRDRTDGKHFGYYRIGDLIDEMDLLDGTQIKQSGNLFLKSDHGNEKIELEVTPR
jgi:hypothetical protein